MSTEHSTATITIVDFEPQILVAITIVVGIVITSVVAIVMATVTVASLIAVVKAVQPQRTSLVFLEFGIDPIATVTFGFVCCLSLTPIGTTEQRHQFLHFA